MRVAGRSAKVAMVVGWAVGGGVAWGQVTRVATFENYTEGQTFRPAFYDPTSGVTFHDSTTPSGQAFGFDYSSTFFGGGVYLTGGSASIGPGGAFQYYFGFGADLPAAARRVSVDAICSGAPQSEIVLEAFDANGVMLGQMVGPGGFASVPFTLEVEAAGYDIRSIRVRGGGGATGYDNVSFTVLPEPAASLWAASGVALIAVRRRR